MSLTSPDGLNKPNRGESDWDIALNDNFDIIQALATARVTKPVSADGILYVKPTGNDANDGLSWGSAKQTILAAYDALPADGGDVNFTDGCSVGGEVANQGLWIAGTRDTQSANLPAGWRLQKRCRFIGHGPQSHIATSPASVSAQMLAGSSSDVNKPALWLSGLEGPIVFENVLWRAPAVGARLAVDSNGTDRGIDCAFMSFRDCQWESANGVGLGPTIDIGYAFWLWFDHCLFQNGPANPVLSDERACILMENPPSGVVGGLIHISDCNFVAGGVLIKAAGVPFSLDMTNCVQQSNAVDLVPSLVRVTGATQHGRMYLKDLEVADAPSGQVEPPIKIEPHSAGSSFPQATIVINCGRVVGPATIFGSLGDLFGTQVNNYAREGQVGFFRNRVLAQHDSSRRSFAPTVVRSANLAAQDVSTWSSLNGTATVTTGKDAPDGSTLAARLSSGSGILDRQPFRGNRTYSVGDWVMGGVWVRASSAPAIGSMTFPLTIGTNATPVRFDGAESLTIDMPFRGDGEWEWISGAARVTVAGTNADTIFGLRVTDTQSMDFYAPIFLHLATGTISDNEGAEIAQHLQSYPDGAPVGHVSTLRGQKLITRGGLGVGNSAAATTPGSVVKKMEVFSETGASLGFVPIYGSIT